jgi:hypothetical protein
MNIPQWEMEITPTANGAGLWMLLIRCDFFLFFDSIPFRFVLMVENGSFPHRTEKRTPRGAATTSFHRHAHGVAGILPLKVLRH